MRRLQKTLASYFQEFRANKRLQYGCAAIVLIALVQGGLNWSDRLTNQNRVLNQVRGEIATLKQQSLDEAALRQTLLELEQLDEEVNGRLWTIASEAVGQARLKDWLNETLARVGATNPTLNLANPRPPGKDKETSRQDESSATRRGETGNKPGTSPSDLGLREFRATIGFIFTPDSLERLLAALEGGEPLVAVDSLTVNKRDRRAEIGIRVLMRVVQNPPPNGVAR